MDIRLAQSEAGHRPVAKEIAAALHGPPDRGIPEREDLDRLASPTGSPFIV